MAKEKNRVEKSKARIHIEYSLFLVLYKILEIMPLKAGMLLAAKLTPLVYYLDRRHGKRTLEHIIYAGVETDRKKAAKMARASFAEFGKLLVEIVKMKQCYTQDKISVCAPESALKIVSPKYNSGSRQAILAVAHYGNWEVAGTAFAEFQQTPMTSLMRPFGNPLIGEKILSHRRGEMHALVDKNQGLRPILRAISAGNTVTMLVDQHAASGEGVEVEFFGHPARMHMTPALLHLKTGIPILPELTRRKSDDFEFEFLLGEPIIHKPTGNKERDIYEITQKIADSLEEMIKRDPVQWLWAPRHWLSTDRKNAAQYADWKRPVFTDDPAESSK